MEESRSAIDLGEDIWHIINSLLLQDSPSSLLALKLTSRSNKVEVDPLLYRRLELNCDGRKITSAELNVQRLLDPCDNLSLHVRDLVMSPPKQPSFIFAQQKKPRNGFLLGCLESVIENLHRLKSFSWNIRRPIPEAIIAKLETRWPNVILNMYAHNHPITDTRSLYSPLLRSLNFCIQNNAATFRVPRKLKQHSKLPELREALLRSPNLRKLDVKFEYSFLNWYDEWSGIIASPHLLHLPLQPGDRLPPLQELVFSDPPETYEFTLEHCQLWQNCMDWSHLRRLDLGISCPQYFFEQLGDRLTSFTALSMGVRIGARDYGPWIRDGPLACDSVLSIGTFLGSIPRLEELTITSFHSCAVDFFHGIFEKHSSLRKFYYHMSMHRSVTTFASTSRVIVLDMLPFTLPELRELTIDLPLVRSRWPEEHANTVVKLFRLDTLKVFVELDSGASVFAAKYVANPHRGHDMPPFNVEPAKKVATDLFKSFFAHNPYACLTSLEVCFLRFLCEGEQQRYEMKSSIRIKRLERDDAPSPLDGGFVVDSDREWDYYDVRKERPV